MTIYVVTNRVTSGNVVKSDGKEIARPTFRVGEYDSALNTVVLYPDMLDPMPNRSSYTDARNRQRGSFKFFEGLGNQLREADAAKQRTDVLMFIHGYNYSFDDSLKHIAQLSDRFMSGTSPVKHLIYFSWPTLGGRIGVNSYMDDQRDSHETGIALSRLFLVLNEFLRARRAEGFPRCQQRFHLMAHSMGNQVLEFMLRAVPERLLFQLFSEVFLLHADVDSSIYAPGEPFTRLPKLASRTHIYTNREDNALIKSGDLVNSRQRLGFRGPSNLAQLPPETFVVDTTNARNLLGNLDLFDKIKERTVDHWGYLYRTQVIKDILEVLRGVDEDDITGRETSGKYPNWFSLS